MMFSKFFKFSVLSLVIVSVMGSTTLSAQAERWSMSDAFEEPKRAGWTQVLLGFLDLVAAGWVAPGISGEVKAMKAAEINLQAAQDLPLSEGQRAATLKAMLENPNNFDFSSEVGNASELKPSAAQRYEKLRSAAIVTEDQRRAAIELAEEAVGKARETAAKAAQKAGVLSKSIKVVRVGASVLFVFDVISRIYVWNALEADPGLSPVAVYLGHVVFFEDETIQELHEED